MFCVHAAAMLLLRNQARKDAAQNQILLDFRVHRQHVYTDVCSVEAPALKNQCKSLQAGAGCFHEPPTESGSDIYTTIHLLRASVTFSQSP